MKNKYIESFEAAQLSQKEVPSFRAGDTLKLGVEISEGNKTRIQNFEGVVIGTHGGGLDATFTIRKIGANSVGVERIFPLYSDVLKEIKVLRRGDVRRARLNYLRDRRGKAAKIKELRKGA
jgi:large subunit ribosomal protein L19